MPSRVPINGRVLAQLREDRLWGHGQLADHARAFAKSQGETCGLSRTQVIAYEAARLHNPKSRYPSRENLRYLVGALRPTAANLKRLLGRTPPSRLAQWTNDTAVKPANACEQAGTAATDVKKPPVDRDEFVHKLVPAVAVFAALPKSTHPLHAEVDQLIGAYATSSPQKLLPQSRRLLDKIVRVLAEPMRDSARRRLLMDASEVAAVAGWMALFAGHPGESDAYFTLAVKYAAESRVDRALGCALASAGMLHGIDAGTGDSATALAMLRAAEPLLPAEGLMSKVVVLRQAEELGALGDEHRRDGLRTLERGERITETDDGEGLYSRRGCLPLSEAFMSSWTGRIQVRLGDVGEGLSRLHLWKSAPSMGTRTPALRLADVALGHTKAGDPEPACEAAVRSLDASDAVGYRVGVERVRRVRAAMPPEWAPLACVRDLDRRLGMPT